MNDLLIAVVCASAAGLAIPAGALLARRDEIAPEWLNNETRHAILALGGGALVAAVALVLTPEGMARTPLWLGATCFAAGGGLAFVIDRLIEQRGGGAAQLMAMLLDFAPEAAALGVVLAADRGAGYFLAVLIGLQNLPEAFGSYREIRAGGSAPFKATFAVFAALILIGPTAAAIGQLALADHPTVLGGIMLASAGGILYLVFEDVAPQARLERSWSPPLGAVAGFLLGLIGHGLTS